MDHPRVVSIAQAASIFPSVLLSGYCWMASQNAIPILYDERPHVSTPLFKRTYFAGGPIAIPCSLVSMLSSSYLAYMFPKTRRLWVTSAILVVAIRFWTQFIMMPGIKRLIEISEDKAKQDKSEQSLEHRQLLKGWVRQNYVRALLLLGAGVAGWVATV